MLRTSRIVATALATLSLGFVAVSPANANPIAPTPPTHQQAPLSVGGSTRMRDDQLPSGTRKDISTAVIIYNHAWNKKTRTLNYEKADKSDRGNTRVRRQMARGILAVGGKISRISKAERAKVNAIKMPHKAWHPSPLRVANGKALPQRVTCQGRNDTVTLKRTPPLFDITNYYNSCRTDSIVQGLNACAIVAGVVTGLGAVPGLPVTVVCVVGYALTAHYQHISSIGAIWVRDQNHWLTVGAQ